MATAIDAENWSDEYKDAKCSICANENKDEIADYYCHDCNKHLCTTCLGIHNKFSANHNVEKGNGDGKEVLTETCGKHADELITLYCRQHEELLCQKCRLLDHRKCQDLQNIRESSDELNADPNLQSVPAQLKSALENINKIIEALDIHVANIQHSGNGILKDLEDYAKKLLTRIEELKVKGKKDINRKQEELLSVVKQQRQACALAKDEINQYLVKITKSTERKASMFVFKKKGQTIAKKIDALSKTSASLLKGRQFNFMTDIKISEYLNCFHSLIVDGSTSVQDIRSDGAVGGDVDISVHVRSPEERQVWRQEEKCGDGPVVKQERKQVNVGIPGDKAICDNIGCCHLSDGTLLVADWKNERLKLVDPSTSKVTKYCDADGKPTDVCCIGPHEVAVAFDGSTQVQVYNTVSLTRTRTVQLGHGTSWIACHGGLLYCAGWKENILYVHDVGSGRKLREISKDTDRRKLFSRIKHITHIAVNSSGDRVYVAGGRGLVCVGVDGKRIFHLSQEDLGLSDAYGVTTDHRGHVYICGLDSHNVVKVTEDGHVVGQVLSKEDGIEWRPQCLSYDVSRSQLCVGGENSDQLLMVKL